MTGVAPSDVAAGGADGPLMQLDLTRLLRTCLQASLGAQHYVLSDMLRVSHLLTLPSAAAASPSSSAAAAAASDNSSAVRAAILQSLTVVVKGELAYKGGASAKDLVTTADLLVQKIIMAGLRRAFGGGGGQPPPTADEDAPTSAGALSHLSTLPFRFVGEEDGDGDGAENEDSSAEGLPALTSMSSFVPPAPRDGAGDDEDDAARERWAIRKALAVYGDHAVVPQLAAFTAAVAVNAVTTTAELPPPHVLVGTLVALQRRVAVFVDPIDGTNAFVEGVLDVPMNLVGIAVDGVPVASVVNRVFLSGGASVSYGFNFGGLRFLVVDGERWDLPPTTGNGTGAAPVPSPRAALRVTFSETTKQSVLDGYLRQLGVGVARVPARGAGYKLMLLVKAHAAAAIAAADADDATTPTAASPSYADVFVCPPQTVKKWDTCAPHSLLLLLGGDIFDLHGTPIRYALTDSGGAGGHMAEGASAKCRNTSLAAGVVAVNGIHLMHQAAGGGGGGSHRAVTDIVRERMQWP